MPSDESKGSQLDAIGSLAQRQLDNTIEMSYEGCIPGVEVRRAIVDAIERKTPKAIEWKETHPDCKCWLALVSRIPDMYFKESFQEEVKDWQKQYNGAQSMATSTIVAIR